MKPIRVQRKRTKGWKMPENTVSVCRPGKWGNPFKVGEYVKIGSGEKTGWAYLKTNESKYAGSSYTYVQDNKTAVELYERYLTAYPKDYSELKGNNLACFCSLDSPCHADLLLEIANP